MKNLKLALLGVVLGVTLAGCQFMSGLLAPGAQPLEMAAVSAAVYTAVTDNGRETTQAGKAARATKIAAIAREVLSLDQGTNMALVDVQVIVMSKVAALNLPAPDMMVAQLFVQSLGAVIQQQLSTTTKGAISPETQLAVATVCNWVLADATAYGAT